MFNWLPQNTPRSVSVSDLQPAKASAAKATVRGHGVCHHAPGRAGSCGDGNSGLIIAVHRTAYGRQSHVAPYGPAFVQSPYSETVRRYTLPVVLETIAPL